MHSLEAYCERKIKLAQTKHLMRDLKYYHHDTATIAYVNNKPFLSFCSNDYLGLAQDQRLIEAAQSAVEYYGVGSRSASVVSGFTDMHAHLQEAMAEFTGFEACLVVSNGYMANLALLTTLFGRHDQLWMDRENHASLWDAALLSDAKVQRYHRQQLPDVTEDTASHSKTAVVTDGVFSISGAMAPLQALADISQQKRTWLIIDDAHGVGVLSGGQGSCQYHKIAHSKVAAVTGGFGKAFGTYGGYVLGSRALIDCLIQYARPYIYTTALPPSICAATLTSIDIMKNEPQRFAHLNALIAAFRRGAAAAKLHVLPSDTPIQSVVAGTAKDALAMAKFLESKQIMVRPMRPPTVPEHLSCCRFVLTAQHQMDDVNQLLEALILWQRSIVS